MVVQVSGMREWWLVQVATLVMLSLSFPGLETHLRHTANHLPQQSLLRLRAAGVVVVVVLYISVGGRGEGASLL